MTVQTVADAEGTAPTAHFSPGDSSEFLHTSPTPWTIVSNPMSRHYNRSEERGDLSLPSDRDAPGSDAPSEGSIPALRSSCAAVPIAAPRLRYLAFLSSEPVGDALREGRARRDALSPARDVSDTRRQAAPLLSPPRARTEARRGSQGEASAGESHRANGEEKPNPHREPPAAAGGR
ncbi:hypothetical protein SKAU_G00130300 [Synaphobranchus kaupii]|uniref:Uncharacterized protein n=1 Tax=Synaphobranchus kaupii TaxID=118154 RepID=A0A9Q1FQN7_SYNKA|nr:hypothetical protein SKAU_G00130300 [Synaphobranchus kaupii]